MVRFFKEDSQAVCMHCGAFFVTDGGTHAAVAENKALKQADVDGFEKPADVE